MEVEELDTLSTNNPIGEICIICEEKKHRGIHLYTHFLCRDCEKDMVHTETNETQYNFYIEKLRRLTETKLYS